MAKKTIVAPNPPDQARIGWIIFEMGRFGSPEIQVVKRGNKFYAIDGSHRLAAAEKLNIPVILVVLDEQERVRVDWLGVDRAAGELVDIILQFPRDRPEYKLEATIKNNS